MLSNANNKITELKNLVVEKNYEITRDTISLRLEKGITKIKTDSITSLTADIKKLNRQKKWLKFGWAGSVLTLLGGGTYLAIIKD